MATEMIMGMAASTLISGISATLQAIQTWVAYRDSKQAAEAFEIELETAHERPEIQAEIKALNDAVPPTIIITLVERADGCWTKYHDMLKAPEGSWLPADLDSATEAAKACVCRELNRIRKLKGQLPPGKLSQWWDELDCDNYCK
jgi:hypothetical protein